MLIASLTKILNLSRNGIRLLYRFLKETDLPKRREVLNLFIGCGKEGSNMDKDILMYMELVWTMF